MEDHGDIIVHLVHGTWGNLPALGRPRARWHETGHPFYDCLERDLKGRAKVGAFVWGWGANLQGSRIRAARRLREEILSGDERTKHVLIGHSHGGNICMQACADPKVARRVAAIVTLATPFLVFRKAESIRALATSGLLMLCLGFLIFFPWAEFGEAYRKVAVVLAYLLGALNVFWIAAAIKVGDFESFDVELPKTLPCHVLILRPAGDEASGVLSISAPLSWAILRANKAAAAVLEPVLKASFSVIPIFIALILLYQLLEPYHQWINVGLWLAAIFLALPLGGAFLLICALRMPFGWDLGVRGFGYSVSSEPSPPGEWQIELVDCADASGPAFAHSGIYDQRAVQSKVVSFLRDAV